MVDGDPDLETRALNLNTYERHSRLLQVYTNHPQEAKPSMPTSGGSMRRFQNAVKRVMMMIRASLQNETPLSVMQVAERDTRAAFNVSQRPTEKVSTFVDRILTQVRVPTELHDEGLLVALRSNSTQLSAVLDTVLGAVRDAIGPVNANALYLDMVRTCSVFQGLSATPPSDDVYATQYLTQRVKNVTDLADVLMAVKRFSLAESYAPSLRAALDSQLTGAEAESPVMALTEGEAPGANDERLLAVTTAREAPARDPALVADLRRDMQQMTAALTTTLSTVNDLSTQMRLLAEQQLDNARRPTQPVHALSVSDTPLYRVASMAAPGPGGVPRQTDWAYAPTAPPPPPRPDAAQRGDDVYGQVYYAAGGASGRPPFDYTKFPPNEWSEIPQEHKDGLVKYSGITGPDDPRYLARKGPCLCCGAQNHPSQWCPNMHAQQTSTVAKKGRDYAATRRQRLLWCQPTLAATLADVEDYVGRQRAAGTTCDTAALVAQLQDEPGLAVAVHMHPGLNRAVANCTATDGDSVLAALRDMVAEQRKMVEARPLPLAEA